MPTADRRSRGEALALGLLVAGAFVFRLVIARAMPIIEVDGAYWCGYAAAIARGDWRHGLSSAWPPLYPAAIALAMRLAPTSPLSPGALEGAARLASALAGAATLIPLHALARPRLSTMGRWIALVIAAVHPRLVEYSAAALSESLFTLLLVSGIAAWSSAHEEAKRRTPAWEAAAGVLLGLAFLTRPEALPLALALWILGKVFAPTRRRLVFVVALLAVCLPWLLFLHARTGEWTLGEKGTYNFWKEHRAAYAKHFPDPRALPDRVNRSPQTAPAAIAGEVKVAGLVAREPVAVLTKSGANLARLVFSTLPVCVGWPVAVLALLGLFLPRVGAWWPVVAPLALMPLLIAPFSADRRFLVPLVPLAILLAVPAIERAERAWKWAPRLVATLLVLGLAGYALGNPARADRAPEQRKAGEWIAKSDRLFVIGLGRAPVVMARKPWVAFYSRGLIADLHDAPPDSILADASRARVDVLVVDARAARSDRPQIAAWLQGAPPGWRVLQRWEGERPLVLLTPETALGYSAGSMR